MKRVSPRRTASVREAYVALRVTPRCGILENARRDGIGMLEHTKWIMRAIAESVAVVNHTENRSQVDGLTKTAGSNNYLESFSDNEVVFGGVFLEL